MTNKITNRRQLAIAVLETEGVELSTISAKLDRIVKMWVAQGSCFIENNILKYAKN